MNMLRSVISNTSSQVISRITSSGTGFLITVLVARSFGISGYSDLAKVTALVSLFYLGIDLGANAIFLQLEKNLQKFQELLSFRLFLAGAIFFLIVLLTYILPYNSTLTSGYSPLVKIGIVLFSLSFFSRAIVYSVGALFQKNFLYSMAARATVIGSLSTLLLVVIGIFFHLSLLFVVGAYVIGGFIEAFVGIIFTKQKTSLVAPSPFFIKKIFFSTLPLTMLLFLNLIYFRVDMILLTLLQKSSAVGIYDFAYKFFDFLIALPLFLSNSLYPILLQLEKNSRIQVKNISLYTILFFFLGLLLVPFVWYLSPLLALVKYDFTPSIVPLRILSLFLPIFFATNILQWIFITKKKQTVLVFIYGASLVVNVFLNLLFIPMYSYVGSAIITGASEGFVFLSMVLFLIFKKI